MEEVKGNISETDDIEKFEMAIASMRVYIDDTLEKYQLENSVAFVDLKNKVTSISARNMIKIRDLHEKLEKLQNLAEFLQKKTIKLEEALNKESE